MGKKHSQRIREKEKAKKAKRKKQKQGEKFQGKVLVPLPGREYAVRSEKTGKLLYKVKLEGGEKILSPITEKELTQIKHRAKVTELAERGGKLETAEERKQKNRELQEIIEKNRKKQSPEGRRKINKKIDEILKRNRKRQRKESK